MIGAPVVGMMHALFKQFQGDVIINEGAWYILPLHSMVCFVDPVPDTCYEIV